MSNSFKLPNGRGDNRESQLSSFSDKLIDIYNQIGFKVSARGWCYLLEQEGMITKAEFNKAESVINKCRDKGYLPIDFVTEDEAREFDGVEVPDKRTPLEFLRDVLGSALACGEYYNLDWWHGEEYYIQMAVEKVDLKTLFRPVCKQYHIPITNMRGQSSKLQRATMARRFKDAEGKGMQCVLLYCGDHDPDGSRISERLKKNIADLQDIWWIDGGTGYDPEELIVDRFGLNYDYIIENNLSWIDNLITGSGKNLAKTSHPNHYLNYVQSYIKAYGARKCEANALVVIPDKARQLCQAAIEQYLGSDASTRFELKQERIKNTMTTFRDEFGIKKFVNHAIAEINVKIEEDVEGGDM